MPRSRGFSRLTPQRTTISKTGRRSILSDYAKLREHRRFLVPPTGSPAQCVFVGLSHRLRFHSTTQNVEPVFKELDYRYSFWHHMSQAEEEVTCIILFDRVEVYKLSKIMLVCEYKNIFGNQRNLQRIN